MALAEPRSPARSSVLPAELTSFIGRREELARIRQLLGSARLVTLTGTGGIGKTRLALRAAREVERLFPARVTLAELGAVDHPETIIDLLANAFGMRTQSGPWTADRIAGYIGDRRALLVVDNCEHVLQAVASIIATLLRTCPELEVLATSRQSLGIGGEAEVRVPPLSISEAVALFADRAPLTDRPLASPLHEQAVAELCRRLDGIPLAVELAAVRLRALTMDELTTRLGDRLRLLARGPSAGGPARQQTLRATIDWSHSLLTEPERTLWRRLSVFGGDFGLKAIESVCTDDIVPSDAVLDLLTSLLDKSMLTRDAIDGESRYRLLESLRQYAHEQLVRSGEAADIEARFVNWIVRLANETWQQAWGAEEAARVDKVEREYGNVRLALALCTAAGGDVGAGLRIIGDLWSFWELRGHVSEARDALLALLKTSPPPSAIKARALMSGGLAAQIADVVSTTAYDLLQQAVATAHEVNDPTVQGRAEGVLAFALIYRDRVTEAVSLAQRAVDRLHGSGQDRMGLASALLALGYALQRQGKPGESRRIAMEAKALCEQDGDSLFLGYFLNLLAALDLEAGELRSAEAHGKGSLELRRRLDHRWGIAGAVEILAAVSARQRRFPRAAQLAGISDAIFSSLGAVRPPARQRARDESLQLVEQGLGAAAAADALALGRRMPLAQAIAFALEEGASPTEKPAKGVQSVLSRRELEVAGLVAEGLSNKVIARRMVISERTVEAHVQHILDKLGAHSRAQIAAWAAARSAGPPAVATATSVST